MIFRSCSVSDSLVPDEIKEGRINHPSHDEDKKRKGQRRVIDTIPQSTLIFCFHIKRD